MLLFWAVGEEIVQVSITRTTDQCFSIHRIRRPDVSLRLEMITHFPVLFSYQYTKIDKESHLRYYFLN